jgi:hypothetical protein
VRVSFPPPVEAARVQPNVVTYSALIRAFDQAEAHSRIVPLRRSFQGGWEALGPNAEAF